MKISAAYPSVISSLGLHCPVYVCVDNSTALPSVNTYGTLFHSFNLSFMVLIPFRLLAFALLSGSSDIPLFRFRNDEPLALNDLVMQNHANAIDADWFLYYQRVIDSCFAASVEVVPEGGERDESDVAIVIVAINPSANALTVWSPGRVRAMIWRS